MFYYDSGPGIAALYLKNIYPWFSLPKKVITDRDPRFTSHFGKGLAVKIGAQQNISTAFHPRTDGLSERKNQWIEQYLRIVTSMAPEDWTDWLSIATAMHNDRKNVTTGVSPNQILWGGEPHLLTNEGDEVKSQMVQERLTTMKERRLQAINAINQSSKGQDNPLSVLVGTQVWLEGTHLRLPYQATKLAPKCYGPFQITREISPVAYQLCLPIAWNIHNVFHASLLSPYRETDAHGPNYSRPPPDLIEGEEEYEVEKVINHRYTGKARTLQYLVKWIGYPEAAPYPLGQHETSPRKRTCTPWCSTASSTQWQKPPGGQTAGTPSKKGFSRRLLMTSRGQESPGHGSIQNGPSKKLHLGTKRTGERSTSNYHAKTDCVAPPNGSSAWTGEKSPATRRTTPQGISPSLPTSMPRKYTTTMTMKTPLGPYPRGSFLPSDGADPRLLRSIA